MQIVYVVLFALCAGALLWIVREWRREAMRKTWRKLSDELGGSHEETSDGFELTGAFRGRDVCLRLNTSNHSSRGGRPLGPNLQYEMSIDLPFDEAFLLYDISTKKDYVNVRLPDGFSLEDASFPVGSQRLEDHFAFVPLGTADDRDDADDFTPVLGAAPESSDRLWTFFDDDRIIEALLELREQTSESTSTYVLDAVAEKMSVARADDYDDVDAIVSDLELLSGCVRELEAVDVT